MGEGASEKEDRKEKKEGEEEEVVGIFRAAPNQLFRQFVSVGVKGRERERESSLKINMQPTRSPKAVTREEERKRK